jgi:transposase
VRLIEDFVRQKPEHMVYHDGDGLCLFQKRLERGRFIWPNSEQRYG